MKNKNFASAANTKKKAFTLVEMLMVLFIVSILAAATLPVMTKKSKTTRPAVQTPVGAIVLYAGDVLPEGWVECDGRQVLQPKYSRLREIMGRDTVPNLGGMMLQGNSGDEQNMTAELNAIMRENQGKSQEEILQAISDYKSSHGTTDATGMVKWIIRAEL